MSSLSLRVILFGLSALVPACSGEDSVRLAQSQAPEEPAGSEQGLAPPAPAAAAEPLYAVGASVFGPEGNTSYVALVPSLDREVTIDDSQVLPIGSASSIYGPARGSFFAVGLDESPTITRYDITPEARFVERETLDFTHYGLSYLWRDPGLVPFLSENKAYIVDDGELQVVIWDPKAMLVVGSFSLDGVADADYPNTKFEPDPTFRGTELLIVALHSTETATAPFSTLISIDTMTDRVTRVVREERCGGLWDSVKDSRGDTYFATGVWDAAQNRVLGPNVAAAPCIVRVKAGADGFDPDYLVSAASIGGSAAGGLVSGGGNTAYIKVLDEARLPAIGPEDFAAVWGGAVWRWWRIELGAAAPATPVLGVPPASGGGGELAVDGKAYVRNADAEFSSTTLLDMSAEGEPTERLTLRGYPYGIVRVR